MAFGIVCALLEARTSGRGQVVDANVLDATTTIMGFVQGLRARGCGRLERGGTNLLDTGAPYYDTYTCADGRWVAMGTVEERFFLVALDVLGFAADDPLRRAHKDRSRWPALRDALTAAFATRPRDDWADAFRDHDACVTPVLDLDEATRHEQAAARGAYEPIPGYDVPQPAVSPAVQPQPDAGPGAATTGRRRHRRRPHRARVCAGAGRVAARGGRRGVGPPPIWRAPPSVLHRPTLPPLDNCGYRLPVVGVGSAPRGSLGDVLAARRRARFVGRSAEIELFGVPSSPRDRPFSVMYLHGPGGVGKTRVCSRFSPRSPAGWALRWFASTGRSWNRHPRVCSRRSAR